MGGCISETIVITSHHFTGINAKEKMNQAQESVSHAKNSLIANTNIWDEPYRHLPFIFLWLLMIWTVLVGLWILNTWSKRQWQAGNLQWVLTAIPVLKALVFGLSFLFWYSCLNLSTCSFWVAFGVFVTRIFFETACFISFLLISHGYCIIHEQLSLSERRRIASLSSLLYLALTGYKAAVQQFAVLVVLMYFILLYVIFLHLYRNLSLLQDQLQHIEDDGLQLMHNAIHTKYSMFKKFQGAMLIMVIGEVVMHARAEEWANQYWMRIILREWAEIGIFFYIGWTFRSRGVTPFFTMIPASLYTPDHHILPPIYSIEMNQKDFSNLDFKEWNIGVPTKTENQAPMLVIVRNPGFSTKKFAEDGHSTIDITSKETVIPSSLPKCKQSSQATSCFKPTFSNSNSMMNNKKFSWA